MDNSRQQGMKIPAEVRDFANVTYKKWKKKYGMDYLDKREMKMEYLCFLFDLSQSVIPWSLTYGHLQKPEIQEINDAIMAKFVSPEFVKMMTSSIKEEGVKHIPEYKLFPLISGKILKTIEEENLRRKSVGDNNFLDTKDIVKLTKLCFKKKYKKMVKAGIDEEVVFNALTAIPCAEALKYGKRYRIRVFYDKLYKLSKDHEINFNEIINFVINEEQLKDFLLFALLERRKSNGQTAGEQKLFLNITKWCLDILEHASAQNREAVLKQFIANRKADVEADRDETRRFSISALSKDEYPNILNTVNRMISLNADNKAYLE